MDTPDKTIVKFEPLPGVERYLRISIYAPSLESGEHTIKMVLYAGAGGVFNLTLTTHFLKKFYTDSSLLNLEESSSPDNSPSLSLSRLNIGLTFLMNNSTVHQVFELRKIA